MPKSIRAAAIAVAAYCLCLPVAWAGCKDGEELELAGAVRQMFTSSRGWSIVVDHLNDEILRCDLMMLLGKNANTARFTLAVQGQAKPNCPVGSPIHATLKLSQSIDGYWAETATLRCGR